MTDPYLQPFTWRDHWPQVVGGLALVSEFFIVAYGVMKL